MAFRVGLIQAAHGADTVELVREAARRGAQVICLQELFQSQYFCTREEHARFDLAEPIPGKSTQEFAKLAREHQVAIVVPLFERRAAGVYHNSAAVLDADGSLVGIYRKMHIPDDPLYFEKFYFTPGDLGFRAFQTRYAKIGVLICWDQWYPEAARLTAMQGAEILFYPTAIGWHPSEKAEFGARQRDAWRTIQRGHAIANGVYVAAANRVGFESGEDGGIEFFGSSFLSDPFGQLMAEASLDREEILVAECSATEVENVRRHWPFFRDRRVDAYGGITARWG